MKDLVIVGAGGCGRELIQWVEDINKVEKRWNILGFIDDSLRPLEGKKCDYKVIGSISDWMPTDTQEFALAIGMPMSKRKVVSELEKKGARFVNIIHPSSMVSNNANLGKGIVIYPHVTVAADTQIGDYVLLNNHTSVGHDASIDSYSTCSSYCDITGGVRIGKDVFMGSSVVIVPKRKIGDGAFLCAGSVVMTNVKSGMKMIGNPAKKSDI